MLGLTQAAIVAAGAFAVGVRRQLRDLGLIAAAGGRPADLRRVVIAAALVLGTAGAVAGVALGVGAIAAVMPWLDEWLGHRLPGLAVPWTVLGAVALLGLVAAVAAALVPARTAARTPVTAALAGHRPEERPSRRPAIAGIVLVAVGCVLTGAAAVVRGATTVSSTSSEHGTVVVRSPDVAGVAALVGGALLVVVGLTLTAPALAQALGRVGSWTPASLRLALRDLGRHRFRSGSAIGAVMAALALPIAVGTLVASVEARAFVRDPPRLADDQLVLSAHVLAPTEGLPDHTEAAGVDAATRQAVADAIEIEAMVGVSSLPRSERGMDFVLVSPTVTHTGRPGEVDDHWSEELVAVDAVDALRVWGAAPDDVDRAAQALADGDVVLPGVAQVHESTTEFIARHDLPDRQAVGVDVLGYWGLPRALISEEAAVDLGFELGPQQVAARAAAPLDASDRAAVMAAVDLDQSGAGEAAATAGSRPTVDVEFPSGQGFDPVTLVRFGLLAAAVVVAVTVVAVVLALAGVEGRRDRDTLAAIGASRAMRRRFRAGQALALTFVAGVLAVPAGLLPVAAALMTRGAGYPLVVAWEGAAVAVVGLPLVAWLVMRVLAREPDPAPRRLASTPR